MSISIPYAGRNDPNLGLNRCDPSIVSAVLAAMMMHLIDFNLAYLRGYARFNVLIVASVISAQISADLSTKLSKPYQSNHAQIILICGRDTVSVQRYDLNRDGVR